MTTTTPRNQAIQKKQKGVSLIGLMVGLLVSMIAILGSLSLYKTLTQVSVDAVFDSQHNGNTASSMLRIQIEIQEAGYGLRRPDPAAVVAEFPHILTIPNAVDGTISQEIRWRTQTSDPSTPGNFIVNCSRIIEKLADNKNLPNLNANGGFIGKEIILQTTTSANNPNCTPISNLQNITNANWNNAATQTELLGVSIINRIDGDYSRTAALTNIFDFQIPAPKDCSPFGMMPTQPLTTVRISYASAASLNTESIDPATTGNANTLRLVSYDLCIANPVS